MNEFVLREKVKKSSQTRNETLLGVNEKSLSVFFCLAKAVKLKLVGNIFSQILDKIRNYFRSTDIPNYAQLAILVRYDRQDIVIGGIYFANCASSVNYIPL
jgi:hypothetical protein